MVGMPETAEDFEFRLLRPEEVVGRWTVLRGHLIHAVEQGRGELEVDDLRKLVLAGRLFIFGGFSGGEAVLAVTAEFVAYPRKTIMLLGFGAGSSREQFAKCFEVLNAFAKSAGATVIQTYCQHPAMVRYHQRHFGADVAYTVMEKPVC